MLHRSRLLALLGLALALSSAPVSATNGAKLTANGARNAGRGGVDYGFADDAIGIANNPSGMAFVYGNRFDQNWAVVQPTVTWNNEFGSFEDRDNFFIPAPAFSFGTFVDPSKEWEIAPLFDFGNWGLVDDEDEGGADEAPLDVGELTPLTDEERYGSRWRLGFGVFPVTGGIVQIKDLRTQSFAEPKDWETDILTLAITPAIAYRINDFVSVGLNLQFIYSKFELDGGIAQPRSTLSPSFEASAILVPPRTNEIITFADLDDATSLGFSWRAGITLRPTDFFQIGLMYQDRTYTADYLGRSTVDGTDEVNALTNGNTSLLALVDPRINPALGFASEYDLRIQDFEQPRYFGIGFSLRPHPRFSFGMDYTFIQWSEFYKTFKVRLSNGNNPNLDIMTSPSIRVRVPLDFEDQHVFAFGISALAVQGDDIVEGVPAWSLVCRAGYNFGSNPTPGETTLPQLPTISEHHVSGGFTLHIGPLLEISMSLEYALPTELDTGAHRGDPFTLSNATQESEILFMQLGFGANF